MKFFRRSLFALGVAAVLPCVLLASVQIWSLLQDERQKVEGAALNKSLEILTLTEGQLDAEFSALDLLSASQRLEHGDFAEFYGGVKHALTAKPHWQTIVLTDVRQNREIFDLRKPFSPAGTLLPPTAINVSVDVPRFVGDIEFNEGDPEHSSISLQRAVIRDGQVAYVLTLRMAPQPYQAILLGNIPTGVIAAISDRDGRIIARSTRYAERVGRTGMPALVRIAHGSATQGTYKGRTYEGMNSFTAYSRSRESNWSVHVAVAAALVDVPSSWSLLVAVVAGVGSVALASLLVVLVLRDLSERRRADETLRQAQKMEAIGQLTGGIAHDFNNLLTAVIGNLDLIRLRTKSDARLHAFAINALEAARRGAKLSKQLLAFSRSQRMAIGPVDLEKLLNDIQSLIVQSVGPSITTRIVVHPLARRVLSETNQLELAFLNLAVNARDAMKGGGTLTITTRNAQLSDVESLPAREYIAIDVVDTGMGMSDEVRARALEPFFTTKPSGQGTGLGLSQVFGIISESGGSVRIESALGAGTTIRLLLPKVPDDSVRDDITRPIPRVPSAVADAANTVVLIVDDDKAVRRFMTSSLQSLGYETYEAGNAEAALEMLSSITPRLLISDFAMPGMNGAELIARARAQHPQMRALIVSGYADTAAIDATVGSIRLLRKPFDVAELSGVVTDVLR